MACLGMPKTTELASSWAMMFYPGREHLPKLVEILIPDP
jgi:hypothetical protein